MDKNKLKEAVQKGNIEWRKHALQRMLEREITIEDVKNTITTGEIIETYENTKPFPSFLFFKLVNNRPLHTLAAFDSKQNKIFMITAYEPNLKIFESDYKTRRKK